MPRPRKCRKVCCLPPVSAFAPAGADPSRCETIVLTVDEYEAICLIDGEGLTQEECAASMKIARTTVQQICEKAHRKIARFLAEGLPLKIEGGDYRLCDGDAPCRGCGHCRRCRQDCGCEAAAGNCAAAEKPDP